MTAKEPGKSPGQVIMDPAYLKGTSWNILVMFHCLFAGEKGVAGHSSHSPSQPDSAALLALCITSLKNKSHVTARVAERLVKGLHFMDVKFRDFAWD